MRTRPSDQEEDLRSEGVILEDHLALRVNPAAEQTPHGLEGVVGEGLQKYVVAQTGEFCAVGSVHADVCSGVKEKYTRFFDFSKAVSYVCYQCNPSSHVRCARVT